MRKVLTGIMLLAGGLAATGKVMQKKGNLSSIKPCQSDFIGVIGKDDRPSVCFAVKRASPQIARDCRIRFFSAAASLSAVLLRRSRQMRKQSSKF